MTELIELISQKKEFVTETKYDDMNGCPKLIQVLFAHEFKLNNILVEVLYLPDFDSYLHHQIASLSSIILSPSNEIRSWNAFKLQLKVFLDCSIFSLDQIEKFTW